MNRTAALLTLLAACALFACAPRSTVPPKYPKYRPARAQPPSQKQSRETYIVIQNIEKNLQEADRLILNGTKSAELQNVLEMMEKSFRRLEKLPPPQGDPDLWGQYCRMELGVMADVQAKTKISYWSSVVESFSRVKQMWGEMKTEFLTNRPD